MDALIAGLAYVAIGRFFPNPSANAFWWRLGAWILSAMVVGAHVAYGQRKGRIPSHAARAVAIGAAIGGFGLALWAAALSVSRTGNMSRQWIISLAAWPLFLAIPTFVVAYVSAILLTRVSSRRM